MMRNNTDCGASTKNHDDNDGEEGKSDPICGENPFTSNIISQRIIVISL
jgi:hypothetical protein